MEKSLRRGTVPLSLADPLPLAYGCNDKVFGMKGFHRAANSG
ncbi:hypothetical protein [Aeromonas allosaccharophila]